MLAEIACYVNRLVSRYYSNTPQNTGQEVPAQKRQGRGTHKFQIRGWATRLGASTLSFSVVSAGPRGIFNLWSQIVYATTNASGVRRLASGTFQDGDVNLVRLLNLFIYNPGSLWKSFERHYPADAARARARVSKAGGLGPGWESKACKQLLGEDRKVVISIAEKTNRFVSKRVAHNAPHDNIDTRFSDLDEAIDLLKKLTEKYTLLYSSVERERLEPLHRAGVPTAYLEFARLEKQPRDLLEEMKSRKLRKGWDSIFLERWATPETISLPLGEMPPPPRHGHSGN